MQFLKSKKKAIKALINSNSIIDRITFIYAKN